MTEPSIENLRKASMAVYLACEKEVADDISQLLIWAADQIETWKSIAETDTDDD